ncbi:MAG: bacterioferritin [Nitrospirota bacterium]
MDNTKLIEVLNKDRADELAAIMQYMGHHYMAKGLESPPIIDMLRDIAMDEMRHAEMIAKRITYLGGEPTTEVSEIKKGGDLKKMLNDDLDAENRAIIRYKEHIKLCDDMNDSTTRRMLEEILSDEEGHADKFKTIL